MLQFEQQYLEALPCAHMYEKSFMHRDTVTHIVVSVGFCVLLFVLLLLVMLQRFVAVGAQRGEQAGAR